jgi:dTDP-4-amino-4,6-dideoxygalactose transaminase
MTTAGEGGMVTTNDPVLWSKMWSYKDHGKSWDAIASAKHTNQFNWVHESFGTNWRMTEIQAVTGRIQLKRMPLWHSKRLANAMKIWSFASKIPALRIPEIPDYIQHAAYKCYVFVRPEMLASGWDRNRILDVIRSQQVPCYIGSCSEVYLEKAFDHTGWRPKERLSNARQLGETSLMFLVHPTLKAEEIEKTLTALGQAMQMATEYCELVSESI